MTKTYWQGELYRNCEIYDMDLPNRDNPEDAANDVRDRMSEMTDCERERIDGAVSEWEVVAEGMAENTGNRFDVIWAGSAEEERRRLQRDYASCEYPTKQLQARLRTQVA